MILTAYGNAEPGDYPAQLIRTYTARYSSWNRFIYLFVILNSDRDTPHNGPDGAGMYAVAVCNKADAKNPASKSYKIRRAMLHPEEAKDFEICLNPPSPEEFTKSFRGRRRIVDIRVERRETNGNQVSVVTHIRRPSDGGWACIEGVFQGQETQDEGIQAFADLEELLQDAAVETQQDDLLRREDEDVGEWFERVQEFWKEN